MKNNNLNNLKKALNSVKCLEEVDNKILTKIHKKHGIFKPSMAIIGILSVITIGMVNAETIIKQIYNFLVTAEPSDSRDGYDVSLKDSSLAEVNYDANIPECGILE